MDKAIFEELQDKYYGLHAPIYKTLCQPSGGGQDDDNFDVTDELPLEKHFRNIDLMERINFFDYAHDKWLKEHPFFELNEDLKAEYREQRICLLVGIFLEGDAKQKKWVWEMFWKESVGFIKNRIRELNFKDGPFYNDILQSVYCYVYSELDKYNPYHKNASYFQWLKLQVTHSATGEASFLINGQTLHYSKLMQRVSKTIAKLRQQGYDDPSAAQIATAMGPQISTAQVELALLLINYYDAIPYNENNLKEEMYQGDYIPEEVVEKNERYGRLKMAMDELTEDERKVVFLKYGFGDNDIVKKSGTAADTEIARILNMTTARVKELHRKALKKLFKNRKLRSLYDYKDDNKTENITHSDLYNQFMDELNDDDFQIIEGRKRDEDEDK